MCQEATPNLPPQVVLCASASARPFLLDFLLPQPESQARAEHHTGDTYGAPEAAYGAPEPICDCAVEPPKKKEEKKNFFGFIHDIPGSIHKLFKKKPDYAKSTLETCETDPSMEFLGSISKIRLAMHTFI